MLPPTVNLDSAIESLKSQGSSPEARSRALNRLLHPRRASRLTMVLASTGAAALALFFLPRQSSGCNISCVAANSSTAPIIHERVYKNSGQLVLERWFNYRSGRASNSVEAFDGREIRSNGVEQCEYYTLPQHLAPNQSPYDRCFPSNKLDAPLSDLALYGQNPLFIVQGVEHKQDDGVKLVIYHGSLQRERVDIYAEEATHRVRLIQRADLRVVYDYPSAAPQGLFDSRKGVPFFDLNAMRAEVRSTMSHDLGSAGGAHLKLCALDADGYLWSIWTLPRDRSIDRHSLLTYPPLRLEPPGRRLNLRHKIAPLTVAHAWLGSGWPLTWKDPDPSTRPVALARYPLSKVGQFVDVDLPTGIGYAHFHRIPVLRVSSLSDCLIDMTGLMLPG
jgi:hypothetical protein